jgi:hypothetical protein
VHELSEKAEQKIQYECTVEMGDGEVEGPVFSVTPMSADGQLLVERRRQVCVASIVCHCFHEGNDRRFAGICK